MRLYGGQFKMNRDFNDVYGQVEYDYSEQRGNDGQEEQAMEEAWVRHILANCNDIVQKYGISFFINNLPNYTKVALSAHYRNLHNKTNGDPF